MSNEFIKRISMGWEIETKKAGDVVKYRIWTNNNNGYIVKKWMTKEEITSWFFWHRFGNFMEEFVKDAMTFPNEWMNKSGQRMYDQKVMKAYHDFNIKSCDNNGLLVKKFSEEVKKLGISLNVSDGEYGFKTVSSEIKKRKA